MARTAPRRDTARASFGLSSLDDLFDYQLETDLRFARGIELARQSLREGHGIKLEDIDTEN